MKTLKNIGITIAIFIGIKVLFAISGQMAIESPTRSIGESRQAASLVEATSQQPLPTDGFERLTLSGGLQVDVPLQWEPLPNELSTAIRTSASALMSNEGVDTGPDGSKLLIAYTSRPTTTYAAIRVNESIPASIPPAELLAASDAEIAALAPELVQLLSGPMAKLEQDLQPGATTTRQLISGHPALVFRYRRLGGPDNDGVVAVELIKIMTPNREVSVTLSYRESEAFLWKSVVENIRRSILVPA